MPDPILDLSWTDASLRNTAVNFYGSGDDADQPTEVRFLRGVARLVRKRISKSDPDEEGTPAVFLLLPRVPETVSAEKVDRHPMLDNGLTAVNGRLWFVGPLVNHGSCIPVSPVSDAALFDFVTASLELGHVPAVVFEPRTDEPGLRYYPAGLKDLDSCVVIPVGRGKVTLGDVFAVIDRVHVTKLVTPDAQSAAAALWQDADKHWPVKLAEITVQMYIDTALNVAFPWCRITDEQPGINGRTDIEIEEIDHVDGNHIRHVLIELKVLRDYGSTGIKKSDNENLKWVAEGVEQAWSYKKERGTAASALCCFDMRKTFTGDDCFAHVINGAEELSVSLRCWHLFASAKEYRKYEAGIALAK